VLQLGVASGVYDLPNRTAAPPVTYSPATMCGATGSDPGHFYHVFLDGLAPATRYYARPVQGATVGPEASFVTGKPLGGGVATRFVLYGDMAESGAPGAVGFISPVSEPFCGSCNRMRLTSDGRFHLCLLNDDEIDVIGALREGADPARLGEILERAVAAKPTGHALDLGVSTTSRSMHHIGG
jgi:hypothetical protein